MFINKVVNSNGQTYAEIRGLSTEVKPTTGLKVGDYYIETDTWNVSKWDGQKWVPSSDVISRTQVQQIAADYLADNPTLLQGKSAYDIAVEQGFVGTEEEWLQSLHGGSGNGGSINPDDIDLSAYMRSDGGLNIATTLPAASAEYEGRLFMKLINSSDSSDSHMCRGKIYKCIKTSTSYSWQRQLDLVDVATYPVMPSVDTLCRDLLNRVFYVDGFYSPQDGNGGYYYVWYSSNKNLTPTVVAGRAITSSDDTLAYLVPLENGANSLSEVNLARFGLRSCRAASSGLDLMDKTQNYADINTEVIESIKASYMNTGFYIPAGRYFFTKGIKLGSGRSLKGAGAPHNSSTYAGSKNQYLGGNSTVLVFPYLAHEEIAIDADYGTLENFAVVGSNQIYDLVINTQPDAAVDDLITETIGKETIDDGNGNQSSAVIQCTGIRRKQGISKNLYISNFYHALTTVSSDRGCVLEDIFLNAVHNGILATNFCVLSNIKGDNTYLPLQVKGSRVSLHQLSVEKCVNLIHVNNAVGCSFTDLFSAYCLESLILAGADNQNVNRNSFTNISGFWNISKKYDISKGETAPTCQTLTGTQAAGYGMVNVRAYTNFNGNYFHVVSSGGGRSFSSGNTSLLLPDILLTFERNYTASKMKPCSDNKFVINCPVSDESEQFILDRIQTNQVTEMSVSVETAFNQYAIFMGTDKVPYAVMKRMNEMEPLQAAPERFAEKLAANTSLTEWAAAHLADEAGYLLKLRDSVTNEDYVIGIANGVLYGLPVASLQPNA